MEVLITGAGGGMGRAVTECLLDRGYRVRALARDGDAPPRRTGVEVIVGDAGDPEVVGPAVRGVDAVVHLAAIPAPVGPPEVVFTNNVRATFVVLEAAGRAGVRRAVIASSISALGMAWARQVVSPQYVPVDEDHPFWPEEPYALSKQVDEATAAMQSRRYGLTVLCYRFPFTSVAEEIHRRAARVRADPTEAVRELWAYLDYRDAAEALRLGVESDLTGSHVLTVTAPDTLADQPTRELLTRFHPTTQIRSALPGRQTAYSTERTERLLGFRAQYLAPVDQAARQTRATTGHAQKAGARTSRGKEESAR